jgi:hypothetical protein
MLAIKWDNLNGKIINSLQRYTVTYMHLITRSKYIKQT